MNPPLEIRAAFPPRPADAHKRSVGTVAVVGGSSRYPHAPVVAAASNFNHSSPPSTEYSNQAPHHPLLICANGTSDFHAKDSSPLRSTPPVRENVAAPESYSRKTASELVPAQNSPPVSS
ncbi:MAG: hypothetical protein IIY62_07895, partial [Kiritimatiellae bacterium]|nr:hypothetical protein [Kiritimatiellia bacterium]